MSEKCGIKEMQKVETKKGIKSALLLQPNTDVQWSCNIWDTNPFFSSCCRSPLDLNETQSEADNVESTDASGSITDSPKDEANNRSRSAKNRCGMLVCDQLESSPENLRDLSETVAEIRERWEGKLNSSPRRSVVFGGGDNGNNMQDDYFRTMKFQTIVLVLSALIIVLASVIPTMVIAPPTGDMSASSSVIFTRDVLMGNAITAQDSISEGLGLIYGGVHDLFARVLIPSCVGAFYDPSIRRALLGVTITGLPFFAMMMATVSIWSTLKSLQCVSDRKNDASVYPPIDNSRSTSPTSASSRANNKITCNYKGVSDDKNSKNPMKHITEKPGAELVKLQQQKDVVSSMTVAEYMKNLEKIPRSREPPPEDKSLWIDRPIFVRHAVDESTLAFSKRRVLEHLIRNGVLDANHIYEVAQTQGCNDIGQISFGSLSEDSKLMDSLSRVSLNSVPGWKNMQGPECIAINGKKTDDGKRWKAHVYPIQSEIFTGRLAIRAWGFKSSEFCADYWERTGNHMQTIIQGQFSERVPMAELLTGQLRETAWSSLPPRFVVSIVTKFLTSLSPLLVPHIYGKRPFLITPIIVGSTILNVWDPSSSTQGPPPDIDTCVDVAEDTAGFGAPFTDKAWRHNPKKRQSFFQNYENLKNRYFEPGLIYTFYTYESGFKLNSYMVGMRLAPNLLDVSKYVDGAPIEANAFRDKKLSRLLDPKQAAQLESGDSRDELATNSERQWLWRVQFCHESMTVH